MASVDPLAVFNNLTSANNDLNKIDKYRQLATPTLKEKFSETFQQIDKAYQDSPSLTRA